MEKKAIIIGAGPAGLTAAYELLKRTDIKPIILEKSGDIGGISKTVNYKGNRIDIGGHRFFSKSDRVMNWWMNIMPIQAEGPTTFNINYQGKSREIDAASIGTTDNAGNDPDKVMLVRRRLSRIYFLRKFFTYPIQLSLDTLTKLGLWTTIAIMFSYLKAQLLPRKPEKNLEDFMINRFGQVLYKLFFKDYTEKVWGIPCDKISAEWGAQRIKGVSISKAIQHAIQSATKKKQNIAGNDIAQKDTETSLIEQFLYPKLGPGQLWEEVARQVESMGGKILMHHDVKRIYTSDGNNQVTAVAAINNITGETSYLEGDYFFSTMPVQELIGGLDGPIPEDVKEVAAGLQYRDFITVGILLKKLSFQDKKTGEWRPLDLKDTWIYIQEKDVKVGRLQLFNNWSPYMVKDPDNAWVGMEFFCNKADDFWNRSDEYIKDLAIRELEKIGLASQANVLDATVLRMEKTYPAYFGTYERFDLVREYADRFENLFLVGRNGMHKYNNSDHSMLTAMVAVDNIAAYITDKTNIWAINTEMEYHEEKTATQKSPLIQAFDVPIGEQEEQFKVKKQPAFSSFVTKDKRNRKLLWIATIGVVVQFVLFKVLYPFPDFFSDSYSYIYAAAAGLDVNIWPIGYSKFLTLVHLVTHSDTIVIALQYLIIEVSALYFFFTLLYFYRPGATTTNILYGFLFFNPLLLYLSNYVSSDGLFLGLSLLWAGQLLWIINRPNFYQVLTHALLLAVAFTVRYNAMYYPLITTMAYILSRHKIWTKVAGVAMPVVLILAFVSFTRMKAYEITGVRQFSVFSGWQLANNALYMYPFISLDTTQVPAKCRSLDRLTRSYFDTIPSQLRYTSPIQGAVYIRYPFAPLRRFMSIYGDEYSDPYGGVGAWGNVSPIFSEYGKYLIKNHPIGFARYFLLPNLGGYFIPPLEKLEKYNMGGTDLGPAVVKWFDYKSTKVRVVSMDLQGWILIVFPALFLLINVYFLGVFVWLGMRVEVKSISKRDSYMMILGSGFFVLNIAFSVLSSPIVFRYQILPLFILSAFSLVYVEALSKASKRKTRGREIFIASAVETDGSLETIEKVPFKFTHFLFNQNRRVLILILLLLTVQFAVFKILYPFVNYIPDSYAYLEGAYHNYSINMWPVGYSKFLRIFSAFFQSDIALAVFQYFILEASAFYFVFTLVYFLKPGKVLKYILIVFFSINPLLLLISNYVLADALFTSLSVLWVAELIWIMLKFDRRHLWVQAILLVLLLTIRYNALYYPLITAAALLISRVTIKEKLIGLGLSVFLMGLFLWHNGNKYKELTGIRQFSGFGGWQLASNALIMYSGMNPAEKEQVPQRFRKLHEIVVKHRDSLNALKVRPDSVPGIYYLWDEHAPLKQYLSLKYGKDTTTPYFKKWASLSPFYAEYGEMLIKKHPAAFAKYFIWTNIVSFSAPPVEFMSVYNMKSDSVAGLAKNWFGYKSQRIRSVSKEIKIAIAYPVITTLANALFVLGVLGFVLFIGFKNGENRFSFFVYLMILLWLCNFGFSVLAAPIVLRYQVFSFIIFSASGLLLFEKILLTDRR